MLVLALGRLVVRVQWEWRPGNERWAPPPERYLEESRQEAMRLMYGSGAAVWRRRDREPWR